MRENAILIISLPKDHHYRRHHHGKGLEASHFSGQRNSIWCSVSVCTVYDVFKTTITAETLLLEATDVDPKANLHNSAQGASWFNLLDCFWKDVTYSHEAWPLALKAGLNDKRCAIKYPEQYLGLWDMDWRIQNIAQGHILWFIPRTYYCYYIPVAVSILENR